MSKQVKKNSFYLIKFMLEKKYLFFSLQSKGISSTVFLFVVVADPLSVFSVALAFSVIFRFNMRLLFGFSDKMKTKVSKENKLI